MPISPRRKHMPTLKQTQIITDRSMRVLRGKGFRTSQTGARYEQELQMINRKKESISNRLRTLFPQPVPGNTQYQRLQQQIIQIQNRAQQLQQYRTNYIREGTVAPYPPRNPQHSWMYV